MELSAFLSSPDMACLVWCLFYGTVFIGSFESPLGKAHGARRQTSLARRAQVVLVSAVQACASAAVGQNSATLMYIGGVVFTG